MNIVIWIIYWIWVEESFKKDDWSYMCTPNSEERKNLRGWKEDVSWKNKGSQAVSVSNLHAYQPLILYCLKVLYFQLVVGELE